MAQQNWTDWADFLANAPPVTTGTFAMDFALRIEEAGKGTKFHVAEYFLLCPQLKLFCPNSDCDDFLWHTGGGESEIRLSGSATWHFLTYRCRHCQIGKKTYALSLSICATGLAVAKFGEYPPFGPPTPARVITLIGDDREIFLKGRRAENQGLGIGAFAYYRRVVENQKDRLFDAIIKVAGEENADPMIITQLQNARNETQFSKAIGDIKPGIPESLKIGGHNPLTLLHTALSQGIHDSSDENCLEMATAIRTVLTQLAERMAALRKDRLEIQQAVAVLQKNASKPKSPPPTPPTV